MESLVYLLTLTEFNFPQLPLPHLKIGYLTAPPAGSIIAPHNDWKRSEFILDHERLQQVRHLADKLKIFSEATHN